MATSTGNQAIRIGFLSASMLEAGAENHQLFVFDALAAHPPARGVAWQGCAVIDARTASNTQGPMLAAMQAAMPVTFGESAVRALVGSCDVVISWVVYPAATLKQLAPNCKIVQVAHRAEAWGDLASSWLAPVDAVVAVSSLAAATVPSSLTSKAQTITNAIDPGRLATSRTRASVRSSWGIPAGAKVFGMIGRLVDEKFPGVMLGVATRLASQNWWGVVVGDGPSYSMLAQSPPANFVLVGADPDPGGAFAGFDYLLAPSSRESFCYSIAQAWYLGLPVVCSSVGVAQAHPDFATVVGGAPSADNFASALLNADSSSNTAAAAAAARNWAQNNLGLDAFGRAWAALLDGLFPASNAAPATGD